MKSPPSPKTKEKRIQDLPEGTGIKRSQAKGRSRQQNPFPSPLPAPEPSRGTWCGGSSSGVHSRLRVSVQDRSRRPGAGLGWRLSLWLCFPSRGGSYSLPSAVSRGAARGVPGRRRGAGGVGYGEPQDTGSWRGGWTSRRWERPEMGWKRGGAAVLPSAPDHTGTTGRSGRGRGAARGRRRGRPSSSPSPS